ncbi:hypothetical protein Dthio_PD0067 [Desulfonatronospira thiodismutans ASO3-1]|uniref:Uncharacterized protein n=2 Tax=Desulfonatronospira thiodismutans TaxID=488939 RepID=D6SV18_9BACT|nr:hypothetical protein Dthio_PD0067 [Desulfonatronospira thiodismutans ASO3-1]
MDSRWLSDYEQELIQQCKGLQPGRVKGWLVSEVSKFDNPPLRMTAEKIPYNVTWDGLAKKTRFLFRLCSSPEEKEFINAFYGALPFIRPPGHVVKSRSKYLNSLNYFDKFITCSLCWRIVPVCSENLKKPPFCDVHNPQFNRLEYQRAYRILGGKNKDHGKIVHLKSEVRDRLQDFMPDPGNMLYFFNDNFFRAPAPKKIIKKEHDLGEIMNRLPYLDSYIKNHALNPHCIEDLVHILSPPSTYETEEIPREKLNDCFIRDLGLAKKNILLAEAWIMATTKRRKSHGGYRKGAGRPQKAK